MFMKPLYCFLLLAALPASCTWAAEAPAPANLPVIESVRLPDYRTVKLENGATLLLMERHQLPLVSFRWLMKSGGAVCDPGRSEGVAMLTARLLRKGTKTGSADEIAAAVSFLASTGASYVNGTVLTVEQARAAAAARRAWSGVTAAISSTAATPSRVASIRSA